MSSPILYRFRCGHLPEKLREMVEPIEELAVELDDALPECSEKHDALRKLLEARDNVVLAELARDR